MPHRWIQSLGLTIGFMLMLPSSHAQATGSIVFERPVHFMTTDGTDRALAAGSYRVESVEQDKLRIVPADGGDAVVLPAVRNTHEKQIDAPVSLLLPDDQQPDVLHLVLLLPGGQALDAIGTHSGVMTRGTRPITAAQLGNLAQLQVAPPPLFTLTPTHGPSGTPVRIEICGLPPSADKHLFGTISIGGKPVRQMMASHSCGILSNGLVFITEPLVLDVQGQPGPVPIRVEVPGSSRQAETVNFIVDSGSPIIWNPRFQIVLGGSAVLDKETSLLWERVIGAHPRGDLDSAARRCRGAQVGGRLGWRLPTAAEFGTLLDPANENPSLPTGHPFVSLNNYPTVWMSDQFTTRDPNSSAFKEFRYGVTARFRRPPFGLPYFDQALIDRMVYGLFDLGPGDPFKFSFNDPSSGAWCVRGPGGLPLS